MNQKLAKKLHRQAEDETIGKPKIAYNDWSPPVFKHIEIGNNINHVVKTIKGIPCRLENCTRKRYKELKKEIKNV